ncbi:MAG: ATP-binding cassette domain-containing protein [Peptoniphilus sp.]|uniref:ATP-binding cassette domain-containing protein n=1 Tax=Peptoniphilus sp. TaxID=1971214 RepID=UPI0025E6D5FF|nr:ATP-binding cassette domain-containing protein [Peptoniphilus sp.]MCI5643078.1 ATP-binding cassette domain-containing protein [Peptoniphilus sp.]MDD6653122.1 ATP-binding cassette domain-containing protein [Clostridium sp.]
MEIEFNNVSFIINKGTPLEKTILNNVTFKLEKGKIHTILGASNSGKTAIADLINALNVPTSGSVRVGKFINDGRRIKDINELRFQTGYVFKNPFDMFFNKTVKKEIEFGMKYFKYKLDKLEVRAIDSLKLVGLDESYLNMNPLDLTVVDAKKVALACAIIYNPKVLILDEFTTGLSYTDKKELTSLLKMLKNKYNKTIILLTKDTNYAYPISDTVHILRLTRLVKSGGKELFRDTRLLKSNNLEVPKIVSFIEKCNKKGHDISQYTNIHDLIKGVYRDVF